MNTTVEKTLQMPTAVLIVRELEAALKAEEKKRQYFYETIDETKKMEFINGEVYFQSPAKLRHTAAVGHLYKLLNTYVALHKLGFVGFEKTLVSLSRNDYEPDICYFDTAKAKKFKSDQMQFPVPNFVVEVLSESTERHDRVTKFNDYAAHGVKEYWIIDAKGKFVEQYELQDGDFQLLSKSKDGLIESVAVDGFAVQIKAIFNEADNLAALKKIVS